MAPTRPGASTYSNTSDCAARRDVEPVVQSDTMTRRLRGVRLIRERAGYLGPVGA